MTHLFVKQVYFISQKSKILAINVLHSYLYSGIAAACVLLTGLFSAWRSLTRTFACFLGVLSQGLSPA